MLSINRLILLTLIEQVLHVEQSLHDCNKLVLCWSILLMLLFYLFNNYCLVFGININLCLAQIPSKPFQTPMLFQSICMIVHLLVLALLLAATPTSFARTDYKRFKRL